MTAETSTPLHLQLWGKSSQRAGLSDSSPYPLLAHLLDTAAAARVICRTMIPQALRDALSEAAGCTWRQWVGETVLLAGWHDIGKATCLFQNRVAADCPRILLGQPDQRGGAHPPRTPGLPTHARDSYFLVWDCLTGLDVEARRRAARIVGAHHGKAPDSALPRDHNASEYIDQSNAEWRSHLEDARSELLRSVQDATAGVVSPHRSRLASSAVQAGVVVLADWVASDAEFISQQAGRLSLDATHETALGWQSRRRRNGESESQGARVA